MLLILWLNLDPPQLPAPPVTASSPSANLPSQAHNTYIGSSGGFLAPEHWRNFVRNTFGARNFKQYDQALMLLVAGEVTDEEYVALVSAIREYLAS